MISSKQNGTIFAVKRITVEFMKKPVLLLFLFIFFITGHAQVNKDTNQGQKTNRIYTTDQPGSDSLILIEKGYLHTDRTYYFPGDDIWFKAYLINAADRLLTNHSNNLHVELISPSSKIIASRIINLSNGLGNGDFKLSDSIRSGRYRIRGYTNYMRNFTDQLFFSKEIIVINSTDKKDELSDEAEYVENKIDLSFFPEGGSLVDNVTANVAFKATNSFGNGCNIKGKIYSSNGDLITSFRSTHLGMGSFLLRPLPGLTYYSVFKDADSTEVRTELPKSFPDGVALSASVKKNELLITTRSNPEAFELNSEHDLLLRFSQRNEVIKTVICKIKSPVTFFEIPTDDLPDGILMLTLSTLDEVPLAERLVYIQKEEIVSIQIETDKTIYNKREPVSLKISMKEDTLSEKEANISLAVVNRNLTENTAQFPRNISSWFLLESDVRGPVEDPSYYFDPANSDRLRDLDLLLRTQGWRDFVWKYDNNYFPPENGFTISGSLRSYSFNKPIDNSRVSIGVFGNASSFLTTVPVDSTGKFKLSGIDLTGDARLIVTGIGKKDRLQGDLHLDSILYLPAKVTDSFSTFSILVENKWGTLKSYYEINKSARKKYKLSDTLSLGEVSIISERRKDPQTTKIEFSRSKYDKPDDELIITEQMESYRNVPELLRSRMPGVVVEGPKFDTYTITIRGQASINAQGQPLVLIDGIPASFDDLIMMPVTSIDRIDVLKSVSSSVIFGIRASSGVINLITRTGGRAYIPVKYSQNIKISGYNAPRVFYSPLHSDDSKTAFEPDLRSTLLWEPDINLVGKKEVMLKYYNGDNTSVIKITAEGITNTGIPVTGSAEYEVK